MSLVAEFARKLHEQRNVDNAGALVPVRYDGREEKLTDIQCVVCDVYGTLVNYWSDDFDVPAHRREALVAAFGATAEFFSMTESLAAMNPADTPAATLCDMYHGLIGMQHQAARDRGVQCPEVTIETVWELLVRIMERHGFTWPRERFGERADLAKCIAYYYNFSSLGRGLYPGVVDALRRFRAHNIRLGIVSNGQFYSSLDLTLFLRDQSGGAVVDMDELFDPQLTFFSYEYGIAKPDTHMLERLFNALYEYHILPAQTLFVGNDLVADVRQASEAGMKTAFFTGDRRTAFMHDARGSVVPDISFSHWSELPRKVSFYEK